MGFPPNFTKVIDDPATMIKVWVVDFKDLSEHRYLVSLGPLDYREINSDMFFTKEEIIELQKDGFQGLRGLNILKRLKK